MIPKSVEPYIVTWLELMGEGKYDEAELINLKKIRPILGVGAFPLYLTKDEIGHPNKFLKFVSCIIKLRDKQPKHCAKENYPRNKGCYNPFSVCREKIFGNPSNNPIESFEIANPEESCDLSMRGGDVVVITGARGSGKTALMIKILEDYHNKTGKVCYVIGIPRVKQKLLPDWIRIIDDLEQLPDGSMLGVDEAGIMYTASSKKDTLLNFLAELARHKNIILIFANVNTTNIDIDIIRNIDIMIVREPSLLQVETERPAIRKLVAPAVQEFYKLTKSERIKYAYLIKKDCKGMIKTELPTFWSDELSKTWAENPTHTLRKIQSPYCPVRHTIVREEQNPLLENVIPVAIGLASSVVARGLYDSLKHELHKKAVVGSKRLDVPFIRQKAKFYCSEASGTMLSNYYSLPYNQNYFHKHAHNFEMLLKSKPFQDDLNCKKIDVNIESFVKAIDSGNPVILRVLPKQRKDLHSVVLVGYDEKKFYVHDPAIAPNIPYKITDLLEITKGAITCVGIKNNNNAVTIKKIKYSCTTDAQAGLCPAKRKGLWEHTFKSNAPQISIKNDGKISILGKVDVKGGFFGAGINDYTGTGNCYSIVEPNGTRIIGKLINIETTGGNVNFDNLFLETDKKGENLFITAKIHNLENEDLKKYTQDDSYTLVVFGSSWCPHCQEMKTALSKIAKTHPLLAKHFIYIDCDNNVELSAVHEVESIPLLEIYKNGKIIHKQVGVISIDNIIRLFD